MQLLGVLDDAGDDAEVLALVELVLKRLRLERARRVSVDAIVAWARGGAAARSAPRAARGRDDLARARAARTPRTTPQELERFADWLRLAELLREHDARAARAARLPRPLRGVLAAFADDTPADEPVLERELRIESLDRLADARPGRWRGGR